MRTCLITDSILVHFGIAITRLLNIFMVHILLYYYYKSYEVFVFHITNSIRSERNAA